MIAYDSSVDVYERLADALDALASGFTRTPSKLGKKLIKLTYTYEEAWLAGQLSRIPETAAEIAKRVHLSRRLSIGKITRVSNTPIVNIFDIRVMATGNFANWNAARAPHSI